jgi:hypothetical protein
MSTHTLHFSGLSIEFEATETSPPVQADEITPGHGAERKYQILSVFVENGSHFVRDWEDYFQEQVEEDEK